MTLDLGHFVVILLASVFATLLTTALRPDRAQLVALVGSALTCFLWLASRNNLPHALSIGPIGSAWPAWSWQVGALSWSISLALFLLTLGALALQRPALERPPLQRPSASARERATEPALIQLLAAVALLACWAGSLATYVLSWTLLNGLWICALTISGDAQERFRVLPMRIAVAFASVLLLWLAAASAGPQAELSSIGAWPTLTRSLVLLAAAYQLGAFSFHLLRTTDGRLSSGRAALLHAAPAASGALLLARLESASDIGLAFALPFTLLGFYALLLGARRAWTAAERHTPLPFALFQAQAGLVLLAGIWAEPQAVLAETAVLLLAGGVLLMANDRFLHSPTRHWLNPGPIIALAALAAVPLTAGFTGRSALYDAWLAQGRWLLVVVTALLHVPLLTAAIRAVFPSTPAQESGSPTAATLPPLPHLLALLLPALGLFSIAALPGVSPLVWLAILLPIVAALLLAWRLDEAGELRQTLQEAFALPLSSQRVWPSVRRVAGIMSTSTREALAILEGEGGLLWLLVFVVIVYLVR